ncbi:MAG: 4Fe-4S dicluster domain-containing protein [Caldithrix sp.]|nr:4Fe-4S dicluster domain-containing protein [Caldithrix sp.]
MSKSITIDINEKWCKGCDICVDVCPKDVLVMENFVAKVVDLDSCTGCMLCEQLCPDFAIVVNKSEKKTKSA